METLFDIEFSYIDYEQLSAALEFSTLSDIAVEHNIIDSIWNSQQNLMRLSTIGASYVENIRKYSTNDIFIKRRQLILEEGVPSISALSIDISTESNSTVSNLLPIWIASLGQASSQYPQ